MNTVNQIGWLNDANKTRDAIICVNGRNVLANQDSVGWTAKGNAVYVWYCFGLANEWNESNPLRFEAKTLKGLMSKLEKHPYKLVKR